jgi:hypothetical protein
MTDYPTVRTIVATTAVVIFLLMIVGATHGAVAGVPTSPTTTHTTTEWRIVPSEAFDVLCLLNTLTADSFYLAYYQDEYAKFSPELTAGVKTALADLKHKVKDSGQSIISASLCLYFSATDDTTLDDLIATVRESSAMQSSLKKTSYYSDDDWKLYESVRGDLDTVFQFLKQIKFDEYWHQFVLPRVTQKIAAIDSILPRYNVIPEVESLLGVPLASNQITVYMLYYSQPHGIKIVGTRFLTDLAWPFTIVVRNAVHEMMHPPYQLQSDSSLSLALNSLKQDEFLMDNVLHHDQSFGYNSIEGFLEEDCVQALDQMINEKLGVADEAHLRWKVSDNGMHVFAVALYQVMKAEKYNARHEHFGDFLVRMIGGGPLASGKLKPLYDAFYAPAERK